MYFKFGFEINKPSPQANYGVKSARKMDEECVLGYVAVISPLVSIMPVTCCIPQTVLLRKGKPASISKFEHRLTCFGVLR